MVERAARELRVLGAPVELEGATATLSIPPLSALRLQADGGTLRIGAGSSRRATSPTTRPSRPPPIASTSTAWRCSSTSRRSKQLLGSVPPDPDIEEAVAVLGDLGYVIAGTGEDDGTIHSRLVLTLR